MKALSAFSYGVFTKRGFKKTSSLLAIGLCCSILLNACISLDFGDDEDEWHEDRAAVGLEIDLAKKEPKTTVEQGQAALTSAIAAGGTTKEAAEAAATKASDEAQKPQPDVLSFEEWSKLSISERKDYDMKLAKELISYQNIEYKGPYTPYTGSSAKIYGSPANGCIASASMLSDKGKDFQLQRWGDNRNYGHPLMINYLADLRARTKAIGLPPLIIGDMSLPKGGTLPKSSHASHTNGLDVDLPFDFALPRKTEEELRNPKDVYIVKGTRIQPEFTPSIYFYIKTAASDPRVERVFVAPMIKKQMCILFEGKEGDGFLHKLRPWFGHQAHMHIRLKCPIDSPDCITQAPIPAGTGCGYELDSWINPPKPDPNAPKPKPTPKPKKVLPEQCKILLNKK